MQSEVHQHIHNMCCLWHDLFTFHLVCRTFDKSLNISEKVTELIFVKSYNKKISDQHWFKRCLKPVLIW